MPGKRTATARNRMAAVGQASNSGRSKLVRGSGGRRERIFRPNPFEPKHAQPAKGTQRNSPKSSGPFFADPGYDPAAVPVGARLGGLLAKHEKQVALTDTRSKIFLEISRSRR